MKNRMDSLLDELLETTLVFQDQVKIEESNIDTWLEILDKRESLIEQLKESKAEYSTLEDSQRGKLQQIYQINQNVLPIIDVRLQELQTKMNNLQRNKLTVNSYSDSGVNAYGAFFDLKR